MRAFKNGTIHCMLASLMIVFSSCRTVQPSNLTLDTKNNQPQCRDFLEGKSFKLALDKRPDGTYMVVKEGGGYSCTVGNTVSNDFPKCKDACGGQQQQNPEWGWCNGKDFKCGGSNGSNAGPSSPAPAQKSGSGVQLYNTTYYPYNVDEESSYSRTTCGDGKAHDEMYFAVTEKSPVWSGECNNDSWQNCDNKDCLDKWDRMPADVKKIEKGVKKARAPSCKVPCGEKHKIYSEDKSVEAVGAIWDACPSQHWNNRFKEVTEGKNPCAKGSNHVDLRIKLYLKLNRGKRTNNIKVHIDSAPVK